MRLAYTPGPKDVVAWRLGNILLQHCTLRGSRVCSGQSYWERVHHSACVRNLKDWDKSWQNNMLMYPNRIPWISEQFVSLWPTFYEYNAIPSYITSLSYIIFQRGHPCTLDFELCTWASIVHCLSLLAGLRCLSLSHFLNVSNSDG